MVTVYAEDPADQVLHFQLAFERLLVSSCILHALIFLANHKSDQHYSKPIWIHK